MKQPISKIEIVWKYQPIVDAEARLRAAFEMIVRKEGRAGYPQFLDLTENNATSIMSHDFNS